MTEEYDIDRPVTRQPGVGWRESQYRRSPGRSVSPCEPMRTGVRRQPIAKRMMVRAVGEMHQACQRVDHADFEEWRKLTATTNKGYSTPKNKSRGQTRKSTPPSVRGKQGA